jgi:hypothetical protein
MDIKDLWSQALGDIKKKDAVPFSTFKGRVVGIDVSIWLQPQVLPYRRRCAATLEF